MKTALAILIVLPAAVRADNWPTYQHDNRRSGVTDENLAFPLQGVWRRESPVPPATAWSGPAKWDAYSGNAGLQSMRNFDPAFYVTVVDGALYFGSSVDHAAHCLDAATGDERWVAFTNSAVRMPPTIDGGRAFFGSDDGYAYAVDARTGRTVWKLKPSPDPRMIPSDGKVISTWPVRTGVMVRDGRAYFGASLFPWEPSYLCAAEAATGAIGEAGTYVRESTGFTLQGALLASPDRLYAPQGRSVPLVYGLVDGNPLGGIEGSGGVYCVLTEEEQLIAMPSDQKEPDDTIRIADGKGRQTLLSFGGVNRMIVSGRHAYFHQGTQLKAVDRVAVLETQMEVNALRAEEKKVADQRKAIMEKMALRRAVLAPPQEAPKDSPKGTPPPPPPTGAERTAIEAEIARFEADLVPVHAALKRLGTGIKTAEGRKATFELWAKEQPVPVGLMRAGGALLVGGEGHVTAYDAASGERLWASEVVGRAYGLAAAGGCLFVSTDRGHIYCFGSSVKR